MGGIRGAPARGGNDRSVQSLVRRRNEISLQEIEITCFRCMHIVDFFSVNKSISAVN